MKVTINPKGTVNSYYTIYDVVKVEFGWVENTMYAYFNGESYPIELLKEIKND